MPFFIIFVAVPLIEIALFITIGGQLGVFMTLLIAFVTAVIGGAIFRHQGMRTFQQASRTMEEGGFPARELFDGFCLVIAAATLVTPGFLTDAIGFLLLVPAFRNAIRTVSQKYIQMQTAKGGSARTQWFYYRRGGNETERPRDVIDVEYERVDEKDERS